MSRFSVKKNLDVIIIALMYLFWIYPVINPFAPPIKVGEKAETFHNVVESLPDEPLVLMCYDYSAVSKPLFRGMEEAFMRHIFDKNGRIVMVAFSLQGPMMYRGTLETFKDVLNQKTYGEDYVFLGFIAGGETGLTSFLANIRNTVSEDFGGAPIDTIPIMENVNSADDFDLIMDFETDTTLGDGFVRQVSAVYGTKLGIACSGGGTYEPYYPDQLQGLLYLYHK
jgi:hypothetical protein